LAELNDAVELLTLDKEQLAIDKEMLEEKVADLELELETTKLELETAQISATETSSSGSSGGGGGESSADIRALAEQNSKLRTALMRLQVGSGDHFMSYITWP